MSVRNASREEHETRTRHLSRLDAEEELKERRAKYPEYVWWTKACKRADNGGYEKGNPHYHVVILKVKEASNGQTLPSISRRRRLHDA